MSRRRGYDRSVFALFLFAKRFVRGASLFDIERETGVPRAAVRRAEERRAIGPRQFEALCQWQGEQPEIFEARGPL